MCFLRNCGKNNHGPTMMHGAAVAMWPGNMKLLNIWWPNIFEAMGSSEFQAWPKIFPKTYQTARMVKKTMIHHTLHWNMNHKPTDLPFFEGRYSAIGFGRDIRCWHSREFEFYVEL